MRPHTPLSTRLDRRQFLRQATVAFAAADGLRGAEAPVIVENKKGNFRFLRGIAPYSSGAVAAPGYEVVHVTLSPAPPYRQGFQAIDRRLKQKARPPQALCGVELRSPRPFTFAGFNEFNAGYIKELEQRGLPVEGLNSVARTNVIPEVGPPSEVLLYGFCYTAPAVAPGAGPPSAAAPPTFVVAGAGELTGERLDARDIIRHGDVSPAGMREKATYVLGLMEQRIRGLGVEWAYATAVEVYTAQDLFPLMRDLLLPRLGPAGIHGVRWHFARPPIEGLEFEMDLRGCRREIVVN